MSSLTPYFAAHSIFHTKGKSMNYLDGQGIGGVWSNWVVTSQLRNRGADPGKPKLVVVDATVSFPKTLIHTVALAR